MITQQNYLSTATAQKTTCSLILRESTTCKYKKRKNSISYEILMNLL